MHAAKKLDSITTDEESGAATLYFQDQTTHTCDVVIGCDGIRSQVRRLILGSEDPASSPRNSGAWAIMTLQPYEEAKNRIGETTIDIQDAREYGWMGLDNSYLMHNILSGGELVQLAICAVDDPEDPKVAGGNNRHRRTVTNDEIRRKFCLAGWPEHLTRAIEELILSREQQQEAFYLWDHNHFPPASTYVRGALCVAGDAAHATTPWQGSGAGMSIEDTLILSTLLGRCSGPQEARECALRVYDEVRRPRTQEIVRSSQVTGEIMTGTLEGEGEGGIMQMQERVERAMREGPGGKLLGRWDFILDLDMEGHLEDAVEMFERMKKEGDVNRTEGKGGEGGRGAGMS